MRALLVAFGVLMPAAAVPSATPAASARSSEHPRFEAALELEAAARASPRPLECSVPSGSRSPRASAWERARRAPWTVYCAVLARASGELAVAPERAHADARAASSLHPERAAPWALSARASMRLGDLDRALAEFERARSLDPQSLEEPYALADWAALLADLGRAEQARAAFRALAPRLEGAFPREVRAELLGRAAELAFDLGEAGIAEAIALLGEAGRQARGAARARWQAEEALAYDRQGAPREAASRLEAWFGQGAGGRAFTDREDLAGEALAARAFVLERVDGGEACRQWRGYLRALPAGAAWAGHARAHLARGECAGREP